MESMELAWPTRSAVVGSMRHIPIWELILCSLSENQEHLRTKE